MELQFRHINEKEVSRLREEWFPHFLCGKEPRIIVLDPEDYCGETIRAMGGTVVDISVEGNTPVNPLEFAFNLNLQLDRN